MSGKIRYVFSCAVHLDLKELFHTVAIIHGETGKSRSWIFFDIVTCGFRYGSGFNDYLLCEFYNLSNEQRATYVTRSINNALVSLLNDKQYYHVFDNKNEFYTTFSDYLGRGWLNFASASYEDFSEFMNDRVEIMVKPDAESGGKGVKKLRKSDYPDLRQMYLTLRAENTGVVEDVILQHSDMAALHPESLNTLRVVTVLNGEGPHIVYAYIRIGNGGRSVDNLHAGGMCAPIELETGKIKYPAYDKSRNTYYEHPRTGVRIPGFEIPFWEETAELCLRAAKLVPQMRYVGWDVGVTENGPVFVEGNNLPGYDFLQMPPHVPNRVGMLPRFREFVEGI